MEVTLKPFFSSSLVTLASFSSSVRRAIVTVFLEALTWASTMFLSSMRAPRTLRQEPCQVPPVKVMA